MTIRVKPIFSLFIIISISTQIISCSWDGPEEKFIPDEKYASDLIFERAQIDSFMQFDPYSPFNRKEKVEFSPLKYFEPTTEFIFKSKLFEYDSKDTVDVYGTKGELRRVVKEGYVELKHKDIIQKLNVYKSFGRNGEVYYSLWFTDKSTGEETYGVGRYLNFEKAEDEEHIYTIDFNRAYNPYCAYSSSFTCPIPRKEDFINFKILAGEKNYHK
ncbi:MAG: DUF1684 domain-containing protein [Ignavibacteria bacterium]|jgi:uncharacterized protein (DUF1684 family)